MAHISPVNTYLVLFLLLLQVQVYGQTIKSEKASLRVNNKPKQERVVDKIPPEIKIAFPKFEENNQHTTSVATMNFVGVVTDESGIRTVLVNSEIVEITEKGVFTIKLELKQGTNEVTVFAMDNQDNVLEQKYILEYKPVELTLAEKITAESKYYGLIIGVDNYEDPSITDLDNPIKDAETLYDVLVSNYSFEEDNIHILKDPTRGDIINSFDILARTVTADDNLMIFYAGHGWWDEVSNNGYWLPSDAKKDNKIDWVRNSTLVDYIKEINTQHTLLITDACFGGAIFKTREAFSDASKAIEKLYELPSRKAMTSGTLTKVPDRSAFIRFLVERLKNNEEKYLSSEQLFSSFRMAVINNSDVLPQYGVISNVGDQGGDFIFIKK